MNVKIIKTTLLFLYREIITVCSANCTKHRNKLCGQNTEYFNIKTGGTYTKPPGSKNKNTVKGNA
jgi:hypothetical protein